MSRFYLSPELWEESIWELSGDEARHASKVLRMKDGDRCVVFDGKGRSCLVSISGNPTSHAVALKREGDITDSSAAAAITLVQSIPKGSNMDWIVQKAVEMGVSRIIPVITERTIVRLNEKEAIAKQLKWKRTALEACKQCGQNILPEIDVPRPFALAIGQSTSDISIVASLVPGVKPIRDVLEGARAGSVKNASLLVGPEGDLTDMEVQGSFI